MIRCARPGRPEVLVVDDEVAVLESIADLLRTAYDVWATADIDEALGVLEREDVALVLTDQRMPSTSGVELLARAAGLRPDAVRVLFTGYTDIEAVVHAINDGRVYRYVAKPWSAANLLALVAETTARHHAVAERRRLVAEFTRMAPGAARGTLPPPPAGADTAEMTRENDALRAGLAHLRDSYWHLRRTQEVLPICMACSRVRVDPAGWTDLAVFIRNHSGFLSHGYCPACERDALAADPDPTR